MTSNNSKIFERTLMQKRPCKHCGSEIYLQYIPVTSNIKWISLDSSDGNIHSCPVKPFTPEMKQLIHEAVERMDYSNNNNNTKTLLVHDLDMIIQRLKDIRQDINNFYNRN